MKIPGVAEFSGSSVGCLLVSLSTMLTDTSMNSSSDGMSSSLKRRRLVSSAELVAEMRSNTDLVCVGDQQVQSASTDTMILSHLQCGATWSALRFLFSCSRRSGTGDAEESRRALRVRDDLRLLGLLFLLVEGSCRADRTCS